MKRKREQGDGGGIIYAMIWFTILFSFFLFVFTQFRCNVYIAKSEMEIGLHIIEGAVMTSSQRNINQNTNMIENDTFERDLLRAHIVTAGIKQDKVTSSGSVIESRVQNSNTMSSKETEQCLKIGELMTKELKNQFSLNDNNEPVSGGVALLSAKRKSDTKLLIKDAVIYEPIYTYTITRTMENGKYIFEETGNITGWTEYRLTFNNNQYTKTTKKVRTAADTPVLKNGKACEGATLEMTIGTKFYGINKIFESMETILADSFAVEVTQSTDIVHASLDNRKQP